MQWFGKVEMLSKQGEVSEETSLQWRNDPNSSSALLGATNPLASAPGTIRGDFAIVSRCVSELASSSNRRHRMLAEMSATARTL